MWHPSSLFTWLFFFFQAGTMLWIVGNFLWQSLKSGVHQGLKKVFEIALKHSTIWQCDTTKPSWRQASKSVSLGLWTLGLGHWLTGFLRLPQHLNTCCFTSFGSQADVALSSFGSALRASIYTPCILRVVTIQHKCEKLYSLLCWNTDTFRQTVASHIAEDLIVYKKVPFHGGKKMLVVQFFISLLCLNEHRWWGKPQMSSHKCFLQTSFLLFEPSLWNESLPKADIQYPTHIRIKKCDIVWGTARGGLSGGEPR